MKDFLRRELILYGLSSKKKEEVLEEISASIAEVVGLDKDLIYETLMERERLGSTGVGEGIAIPHGKIGQLKSPVVAVAISREGIEFGAIDNKPVKIFVTLLTPEEPPTTHLGLLARLARILKSQEFQRQVLSAEDSEEIYKLFVGEDERILGLGLW